MLKNYTIIFGFLLVAVLINPIDSFASAACSHHDGIDCEAGVDIDGSVICTDGWIDSEILYSEIKKECGEQYVEYKK
ncbi:hypothetical protein A2483_00190 [Candidatus Peregrinibacteria bacterium RIFOXYC2_FULL_33_13]|nr:MAG: hypothetical protein UR27_C0007G0018 [Candidatus Peregrinibacteria bacterium GW2011_GWA2_33_10]KKP40920.1 MAG: hypothetical protein UR30_C0003G0092 [Candidatus Peregrinibacteria bacterium GW2011_GWC2_33_13]OGJ52425.1 MAG: hypothetical protein A2483_00190 [Candidatus Peregrinibacteria bacterium RIFOXYC2_FULL_33_13]